MNFNALLQLASAQSAKSQIEAAEKERARLAAVKEAAVAQSKKEAAERKAVEERRRDREAKERKRLEEEKKKQLELPKTRNLYELKKEREKRGLHPDGRDDPSMRQSKPAKVASTSKPKASTRSRRPAKDSGPLTREEKLAKQRAALFKDDYDDGGTGGMALARAQLKSEGASRPSSATGRSSATRDVASPRAESPRTTATIAKARHLPANARRPGSSSTSKSTAASSARDRLTASFNPHSFVALNQNKRDMRTIEEVERDIRLQKGIPDKPLIANRAGQASSAVSSAKRKPTLDDPRARDLAKRSRLDDRGTTSSTTKQHRRRASSASGSADSDSESESGDDRCSRGRKGKEGYGLNDSMKSEIWKLLGRDRQADMRREALSDDSDDDMEANGDDLRREEEYAARLAAKEDKEEEARLRAAAEKKQQLKAQRK